MVILNLYRIPFHAVVVLGSEHDFLFKSTSTHCDNLHIDLYGFQSFNFAWAGAELKIN